MPGSKEIPDLVGELYSLSKDYVVQEVVDPARRLSRRAGFGVAAGAVLAVAAAFFSLALYPALLAALPAGDWWTVLARGLTALVVAAAAGIIGWRAARTW